MSLTKKKKPVKRSRLSWEKFWLFCSGVLAGVLLLASIAMLTLIKNNSGINIYINGEKVLKIIGEQIERHVQEEFPGFIEEIKLEAPSLVEKYMHDFISIGNLEIGGYTVNLPPQFIKELENDLRHDVTGYVLELLDELEKEQFVLELSRGITGDVLETLLADLNGQLIEIPFTKRYSIPVIVRLY